ncbi:MAG TPA: multiheme c-type cytochrome [Terriglobales bacterium]|nr:multiheme c-type cytochrome [Terriglobales bacterium]
MFNRVARIAAVWLSCIAAGAQSQPAAPENSVAPDHSSHSPQPSSNKSPSGASDYVGNEACAGCHASIYQSYKSTPMARASGPAIENLIPADFVHEKSGVHYRVYSEANHVWLSFDRPGDPEVRGRRELLYYIGSGRRGLSYLFARDGFLYESPVNWYSHEKRWDMAPAYQNAREIPLNLPAFTSCLRCHVSGMRAPVAGTENRYRMPVFQHSGVSCERCHGPGAAHAAGAAAAIVNPAKLSPQRRDAVCMQCHLEGKVAIERPGHHAYEFRPGEALTDYIRYYVFTEGQAGGLGGVSQVEALTQSLCKRKSGDAMSCTSCHDPHYEPPPEERVSYYREKCLACHGAHFAAKHHANQPDCTLCHMPAAASTDVAHTQVTDHRIPRRPEASAGMFEDPAVPAAPRLVPFPDSAEAEHDVRDLALAWQSLANGGMEGAEPHAEALLRSAVAEFPSDPDLLAALAYVEQKHGLNSQARELYQRALAANPDMIDAATDLGVIEAQSGHLREAMELWQSAFRRAPGRSNVGMNLVAAFCEARKFDEARATTLRVLEFNPDMSAAKRMLQSLNHTPSACAE